MKKELGYRIRKLRESRDYTQENMAVELGITAGAYAKIERGETDPSFTRLFDIAEVLEVDLTTMLTDKPQNPFKLEEAENGYGFASKAELDKLALLISQINRKLEKLEAEIAAAKKGKTKN